MSEAQDWHQSRCQWKLWNVPLGPCQCANHQTNTRAVRGCACGRRRGVRSVGMRVCTGFAAGCRRQATRGGVRQDREQRIVRNKGCFLTLSLIGSSAPEFSFHLALAEPSSAFAAVSISAAPSAALLPGCCKVQETSITVA